jgi:hypothetical protein
VCDLPFLVTVVCRRYMSAHDGHFQGAFSRGKVGTTSALEESRRIN